MKIDDKYKWLVRNLGGTLMATEEEPTRGFVVWLAIGNKKSIEEFDERFSFIRWENELPTKISDIGNILAIDSNDIISKPSHYIGINGLEVEQILAEFLPRFTDGYEAHRVGSAIEYLLRSPLKNGIQDIEKAGQNIEQFKEYNRGKQA